MPINPVPSVFVILMLNPAIQDATVGSAKGFAPEVQVTNTLWPELMEIVAGLE
jgi:hypothetical protein